MISSMSSLSRGLPPDRTRSTTPRSRRMSKPFFTPSVDSSFASCCCRHTSHPLQRKLHFLVSIHCAWYGLLGVKDRIAMLRAFFRDMTNSVGASLFSMSIQVTVVSTKARYEETLYKGELFWRQELNGVFSYLIMMTAYDPS